MKKISRSCWHRVRLTARAALGVAGFYVLLLPAAAQAPADAIRKAAREEIEAATTQADFKKQELTRKYAAALESLEKKLTTAGDLALAELLLKKGDA